MTRPIARKSGSVGRARGFSLIELLISVGAIALLAVGIAKIFATASTTVRVGQRVSHLNGFAASIEQQLRRDFSGMSREGFLMIRNQFADGQTGIELAPNGGLTRARRVDEMVFFVDGQFVSRREAILPGRQARSDSAMIYLGHGLGRNPDNDNTFFDAVDISDENDRASVFGENGPNRFASDWTLLRLATLLAQPAADGLPFPTVLPNGLSGSELQDNDVQIGLQPAAPGIFRIQQDNEPTSTIFNNFLMRDEPFRRPHLASGAVDIATTDLTEVRGIVLGARAQPPSGAFPLTLFPTFDIASLPPASISSLTNMQWWMRQALPADSDSGVRVRTERAPPDLLGVIGGGFAAPGQLHRQIQRSDQQMLTASAFVPRCTEFIVEWSFGKVVQGLGTEDREVVWHGLDRRVDNDGDGIGDDTVARAYRGQTGALGDGLELAYRMNRSTRVASLDREVSEIERRLVPRELIHGPGFPPNGNDRRPLYSYFGYIDPTFVANPEPDLLDRNGDGDMDPGDRSRIPDSVRWPWPKLIRITMTLVDPQDPTAEESFQFVFEVPEANDDVQL